MQRPIKDLVLPQSGFAHAMRHTVEPLLAQREEQFWLEREGGARLYCLRYRVQHPKGIVLLSHGYTETVEKYREAIYYFLCEGYTVYAAEHCGHGRSYRLVEDPSLVHVDDYRRYVWDLLELAHLAHSENPSPPLYLYGHSMGGGIAAAVLAREPELFQKAVLCAPMIRPLTGNVPWPLARLMARVLCLAGQAQRYVPGNRPFAGPERFEESASTCRERFEYYQQKRCAEPLYQMNAASCGWLDQAGRLSAYLMGEACKRIACPLLILQAEQDTYVSTREQDRFAAKIDAAGRTRATLIRLPARHELFNADDAIVQRYWGLIFDFLQS